MPVPEAAEQTVLQGICPVAYCPMITKPGHDGPYWIWWSQKRLRKVDYRRDLEFELLIASVAVAHGGVQVPVELGDDVEGDLLG